MMSAALIGVGKLEFTSMLGLLDHARPMSNLPACVPTVVVPEHVSTLNV